jgi:hypothetical protein
MVCELKHEVNTEAFHAVMYSHWLKALESHRQEIAHEGMTLARRLTLERLEALVKENEPES